jgi:regulator of protease activity HflC (stomatin/prohibitin superfamily)
MYTLILFSSLSILVVVLLGKGIRIVKQSEAMLIERLGKYHRTLESGINIVIPVIDRPRQINWRYTETGFNGEIISVFKLQDRIDLRENVYDFPKQNVITRDNVVTEINALIYFQIIDPLKSVYEIGNLPNAIEKLTQTTLRNVVGEMDLDQCLSSRDTINATLRAILEACGDEVQPVMQPPQCHRWTITLCVRARTCVRAPTQSRPCMAAYCARDGASGGL